MAWPKAAGDRLQGGLTQEWIERKEKVSLKTGEARREGFPDGLDSQESACNAGDLDSIPGLRRSPGGGDGNPLQYLHGQRSLEG